MYKLLLLLSLTTSILFSGMINSNISNHKEIYSYINKLTKKEKQIIDLTEKYLLLTGDTNISVSKLNDFFKINNNFWQGLTQPITISLDNSKIIISNLLTNKNNSIDNNVKNLYLKVNKNYNSFISNNKTIISLNNNIKNNI